MEYTQIIEGLLNDEAVIWRRYYSVSNLGLTPPIPSELYPGILMSGSSEVGWPPRAPSARPR